MNVIAGRLTQVCPFLGDHMRTSFMSSSLLLQQCLSSVAYLSCMLWEMGDKWSYNDCFVNCYIQTLFIHIESLCSSHQTFYPGNSLKSKWCSHTLILTRLPLEIISVLYNQINQISYIVVNLSLFKNPSVFNYSRITSIITVGYYAKFRLLKFIFYNWWRNLWSCFSLFWH